MYNKISLYIFIIINILPISVILAEPTDPQIVTKTFESTASLIGLIADKTNEYITMISGICAIIGAVMSGGGAYSKFTSAIGVGCVAFILVTIFKATCGTVVQAGV